MSQTKEPTVVGSPQGKGPTPPDNALISMIPVGVAGIGALIAYKKGYRVLGFATLIISGFAIGYGIRNTIKYGNIIGWK